jgi:putative hydrolase of the HAD superfamily
MTTEQPVPVAERFSDIDVVLFDYGNTLIEFGPNQVRHMAEAQERGLRRFGGLDPELLRQVRDRQLAAPFLDGCRESTFGTVFEELLREVVGVEPTPQAVARLEREFCDAFRACVVPTPGVVDVLRRLGARRRLAIVSNYPCGKCIRDTLTNVGLTQFFDVIVVSGDLGYCKPHPRPFEAALHALRVSPTRALHVGDNWLADVQGAKRLGMRVVLTSEYTPYQHIEPGAHDFEPDARIRRLAELEELLRD